MKFSRTEIILGGIILLVAVGSFAYAYVQRADAHEIQDILATTDLDARVQLYRHLIERVGPEQAQDDLYRSGLPFDGQTHLLNHTVGDWLYDKYGNAGLVHCRDYFLSSCYHGFVLHVIAQDGDQGVQSVMDACRPAGPPVFTQCAHAVGHGFLTWVGYANLPQALERCDAIKKEINDFPLFNCHDGVFMENIWAVHDGAPSPDRWIKTADPLYPCDDSRIKAQYRTACWSNQPSLMAQLFKGDFARIGRMCDQIKDQDNRTMCFNGLSRQIHPVAAGSLDATFGLCGLLPTSWVDYCLLTNANASFSVGDRSVPFSICQKISAGSQERCYQNLIGAIRAYARSDQERLTWCGKITDPGWQATCQ